MSKDDREHFKQYTPQNRIKHEILSKYFGAYLKALSNATAFHYVDGFSGGGLYEEKHSGSPLIGLKLLAEQSKPFAVSFVENDGELFDRLKSTLSGMPRAAHQVGDSFFRCGQFHEYIDEILAQPVYDQYQRVATFAFVDPCGVKGVRMRDIGAVLGRRYGECLLFWNYDGINRWLGLVHRQSSSRAGLVELFGDEAFVEQALRISDPNDQAVSKEERILEIYIEALRRHAGEYIVPFRVEAKDADRTSHYLIHCSRNAVAFRIMKDVMAKATTGREVGSFEFMNAMQTASLFSPVRDRTRDEILRAVTDAPRKVSFFTVEWVSHPQDLLTTRDYKQLLLQMESNGEIEIWDKDNAKPVPRDKRRKSAHDGGPTVGDGLYVRRAR